MNVTTTTTHAITFSVIWTLNTEGGMDSGEFTGGHPRSLEEAMHMLEIAKASDSPTDRHDWHIRIDAETKVTK